MLTTRIIEKLTDHLEEKIQKLFPNNTPPVIKFYSACNCFGLLIDMWVNEWPNNAYKGTGTINISNLSETTIFLQDIGITLSPRKPS
jgi:hypothetical protein